jgi:hypothetical protein
MKNLESILAENMRRFNTKNLSEQAAGAKAGGPAPAGAKAGAPVPALKPAPTDAVSKMKRLDPELPTLLDEFSNLKTVPEGTVTVKSTKNSIVKFTSNSGFGSWTADIYQINAATPIPVPYSAGQITDRKADGKSTWRNANPEDVSVVNERDDAWNKLKAAGKEMGDKLNGIWNSSVKWETSQQPTPALLEAATNLVVTNPDKFKPAFQTFTRSRYSIDNFWNDNPQSYTQSRYFAFFEKPVTGNAKKILLAIQDKELKDVITFKADPKNWNSAGKYPSIKIPTPLNNNAVI